MIIIKRNGDEENFNPTKIARAAERALRETETSFDHSYPEKLGERIKEYFEGQKREKVSIEEIQDQTELTLMMDYPRAGKAFLLYRTERENLWKYGWDMTDLQRDIYESKYRYKKESFKEFVERVAKDNRPIQKAILEKKFIPAGRILAGRGLWDKGKRLTLNNCFAPGTKVLTQSGYKPIEQIQKGEYVLTGDGTYQKVNETMVSDFSGELIVFDKGYTNDIIKATPNHKFLTQEGWKTAEEIYIHNNKAKKKQYYGFLAKPSYPLIERTYDIKNLLEEKYCLLGKPTKEKYVGPVYNLSVENNHEYYVEGILAHNCYVLPSPEDNLESIWETARDMARTYSYGGGVGINISKLRPKGFVVNNAAQTTSGAISFMDLYSLTTGLIGQNSRRGALLIALHISHPDIEEFIDVKNNLDKVTFANISLQITQEFLDAAKENKSFNLSFTTDTEKEFTKKVNARDILRKIAKNIHNSAEPGILFWDNVEGWHLKSEDPSFKYEGVNPCGEAPLPAGGACCLSSINLSQFVVNPFLENSYFDISSFEEMVKHGVTYLNEILDENLRQHPLQIQKDTAAKYREIGLGIAGLADTFIKLGITYGSEESITFIRKVMRMMINAATYQSAILAKQYGPAPGYTEYILESPFFKKNMAPSVVKLVKENGLRNTQLLAIAPTGSIATLIGASTGAEPIFQTSYNRRTLSINQGEETQYKVFTPVIKELMEALKIDNEENLPDYVVSAMTLDPKGRVVLQGVLQEYVDAAISSTVNLPEETTVEEILELLFLAGEHKLKGITAFRDGGARAGILTLDNKKKKEPVAEVKLNPNSLSVTYKREKKETPSDKCSFCGGTIIYSGGCSECQDCGGSACSI